MYIISYLYYFNNIKFENIYSHQIAVSIGSNTTTDMTVQFRRDG